MNLGLKSHNKIDNQERSKILAEFGASDREIEELLVYNQNVFAQDNSASSLQFPLPSEPHIAVWQEYLTAAETQGTFATLKNALVQLQFPIQAGISQTEDYRAATRKGIIPDQKTGLVLQQPEVLQLKIHQSLAGEIPVLLTTNRDDFVSLVRAITKRNEPVDIPDSMGACMVAGYNNWDRIRRYKEQWLVNNPELSWSEEFKRLMTQKELYQDRFIILSDGFYSNVQPAKLGLTAEEWRRLSLTIRLEHECTHYFTRRVFNSMRNNLLDELIADYQGMIAATGTYKADWFLHFLGLEFFPDYREGGRLQNYPGQPPLSDGAFKILQKLVKSAAENLEAFEQNYIHQLSRGERPFTPTTEHQTRMLMALTSLTIEELASSNAGKRLQQIIEPQQSNL
ncbi:MAG: hypothetical protein RLZZ381_1531 [Cyanobacteriota bacterium]|jgi:hypothetical protein